ncbi:hypothetical protein DCAR_0314393 [Daucus carota subsp. sativus]|uniref:Glutamate receptor n=1 Tax=Daucus carota subsp. sativus TaxID=79200 RepID=A0AAF0WU21_DAUCS|nr:hypothetical protein DCAR_0314393 [Daucus carota subsp. sativus]
MDLRNNILAPGFHSSCVLLMLFCHLCRYSHSQKEFRVGVIVDMGSWNGKIVDRCITMATSDFYNLNAHYKTRIIPQTTDSKGDPLQALEAAQGLVVKNVKAMIVGPEMSLDEKLLALISDEAKVPIFSLSGSASFDEYPYFLQLSNGEALQFEATATLAESFQWKNVIFICEDSEFKSGVVSHLFESFQEKNIQIDYISSLSPTISDDGILAELHKLMGMETTIFVLHMKPSFASRLFLSVKTLGMMSQGYAWIFTDKTRNHLHSMNPEELMQSIEGALALKPYELSAYGLWAYDAVWALAKAVEGVDTQIDLKSIEGQSSESTSADSEVSHTGKILLDELVKTRIKGLSGDFKTVNRTVPILQAFEIVNVIREGERRVGFWAKGVGITRDIMHPASSNNDLKVIIWPGGSIVTPRGMHIKKLRVGIPHNTAFKEFISQENDPQTSMIRPIGFCVDVFQAALELLPYNVMYEFIPSANVTGETEGTYNDLLYQIYLQRIDAAVGDISITAERSLYVDFTTPYTDIGVGTIVKIKTNKDMWIFTKPIGADLCLMTAVFFILTALLIWVIEKPINKDFQGSPSEQLGTIFFSTLFFSSSEKLSSNLSRFVILIWALLVLILTSSYTATLASMLTVQQIGLASNAIVGYRTSSFVERNTVSNINYKDYRLRPYSSAEQYADALSKGSKNGGIDGILDEIPYIQAFLSKYSADYTMVDSASSTNGFGFAFPKGSSLVHDISRAIANLREDGRLEMLQKEWYNKPRSLVSQETLAKPQVLKIDRFGGLFLVTGVSLGLALIVIIYYFIRKKLNVNNYIFEKLANGNLAILMARLSR